MKTIKPFNNTAASRNKVLSCILVKSYISIIIASILFGQAAGQVHHLDNVYQFDESATTEVHWQVMQFGPGESKDILNISGKSGIISSLWGTFNYNPSKINEYGQAFVIKMYWDNSSEPAVEVPLSDFFGQAIQLTPLNTALFKSSNDLAVFNSLIPMPFRSGARIELENQHDERIKFWYQVDINYKPVPSNALYFHAYWQQQTDLGAGKGFTILPEITGKGRYLGTSWAVIKPNYNANWYTRNVKIDFDNQSNPTGANKSTIDVGTLDDYVGSGWWSKENNLKAYTTPYAGRSFLHIDSEKTLSVVCYRYYIIDPLYFKNKISVNMDPGGGQGLSDWSTVSYFYLETATSNIDMSIPHYNQRINGGPVFRKGAREFFEEGLEENKDISLLSFSKRGISFNTNYAEQVTVSLHTLNGQLYSVPFSGMLPSGDHSVSFDPASFAKGVYLLTLKAGSKKITRRL